MRCDRTNRHGFDPGSLERLNETKKILGELLKFARANQLQNMFNIGVGHQQFWTEASSLAGIDNRLVIVNRRTDREPTNQSDVWSLE